MVADQALFIEDGHIILDHDYKAGDKIRVLKKFRGGAAAAKNIEKLTFDHLKIIDWFSLFESADLPETDMRDEWFRKSDFQNWFMTYSATANLLKAGPFAARFSELVGFGIFQQISTLRENFPNNSQNIPQHLINKVGPFYRMNWNRLKEIRNNGHFIWSKKENV